MADTEDVHRRDDTVEEVAEEQVPPLNFAADPVDDVAEDDSDTEELLENEGAKLETTDNHGGEGLHLQVDNNIKADSIMVEESVECKVETSSSVSTVSTTTVREEHGVIVSKGASTGVEEKIGSSDAKPIVFEYDPAEEVIELDLESFHAHNPHCPNCNHRFTKIILRKKKQEAVEGMLEYYCKICVTVVKKVVSRFESTSIVRKLLTLRYSVSASALSKVYPSNWIVTRPPGPTIPPPVPDPSQRGKTPPGPAKPPVGMVIEGKHTTDGEVEKNPTGPKEKEKEKATLENGEVVDTESKTEDKGDDKPVTPAPTVADKKKKKKEKKKKKKKTIGNGEADDTESETDSDDETEEPEPVNATTTVSLLFNIRRIDPLMLLEILKCIVYGGLIESITSFSVVASAAATDATSLNVFAIALAILFSGLIAFTLNLLELKNMKSNKKYKEVLGNKKGQYYFAFHATFAILSYIVFGLIAPATYAFTFHEGDSKKCKILAAAAAAFACVFLLAMAKAHVSEEKDKLLCYIKTTRYYLVLTFLVSGVAYAMGFLVEMVALKLGLFTSVQRVTCYAPQTAPAWTTY